VSNVNVAELMTDPDFISTIILRRPAAARFANEGENIATYEPDVNVTAIVQPADAQQIASLPQGSRGPMEVKSIWSATELRMADGKTVESDILVIDGLEYKVVSDENWSHNGYYFVLAAGLIS
jgi:hypothetical protein